MKKSLGKQTYLFPLPVLIIATFDEKGNPDAMNAAWGGIHDTNQVHLCLSTDHKTTQNIMKRKAFTISFATKDKMIESDYFGIVSGNDETNKIKKAKMHVKKSENVDAPVIEEYPVTLECEINSLVNDNQGTTFIVANIINVLVDESVLDNDGKIDFDKFKPLIYEPSRHNYYAYGEKVGNAFKEGLKIK